MRRHVYWVALERNELHDDNSMLHSEILELQNKLRSYDADGRHSCFESPAFPQQQPVVIEQHYGTTPSELQLFPESTTSEDSEPSQEHGISDHVTRPQAKYPTPTATLTEDKISSVAVVLLALARKTVQADLSLANVQYKFATVLMVSMIFFSSKG
uniref:Uncharacterized protein n=1 Tax=Oryza nivara TaxID=4536 RepID=A0A0E0IDQ5_ORYNI